MKKILFLIITVLVVIGCNNDEYNNAIVEVYGKAITPTNESDGLTYSLGYSNKFREQEKDELRLKDRIDKITQTLGDKVGELPTKTGNGYGVFYQWENSNVRVLMVSNYSLENSEREIKIVVNKK